MPPQDEFRELLRRVRAGDAEAAKQLVEQYASVVRLEVRVRLRDPRLRRSFDSLDVCQSVLASFFVRAAAGQYDLDTPEQVVRLLVGMARNKVASRARRESADRRDARRNQDLDAAAEPAAGDPTPSRVVAAQELLAALRGRLSDDERAIADLRAQGRSWDEVAGELGGTAQARRKQLSRALNRIAPELGLEADPDE
jgi:RNA polymerase sigma-70 factor (ECF subfamily)